jgi:hypothetical protein
MSAATTSRTGPPLGWTPLLIAALVQWISLAIIALFVRAGAWDDGAITLAFSKTFAQTGRIALTPISEQVEGYSSVSWFLLNAALARWHPDFEAAILIAQVLSAIFLSVTLYLQFFISRRLGLSASTATVTLLITAIGGPSIAETANGMEMTLLSASGLAFAYFIYFRPKPTFAVLAATAFCMTRFEAPFYLFFIAAPLVWTGRRREAVAWMGVATVVVATIAFFRYHTFSDFLPNTIYAKMNPPYRALRWGMLRSRIEGILELPLLLSPFIVASVLCWLWGIRIRGIDKIVNHFKSPILFMLSSPVMGAEAFSLVAGKNWGYDGRMEFFSIPFALMMTAIIFDRSSRYHTETVRNAGLTLALLTIPVSWVFDNGQEMWAIAHTLRPDKFNAPSLSPEFFRDTGRAVDRLRTLLNMDSIVYMTSDVGGVGLCCSRIRIVDIGLLASRSLARNGYSMLPAVLATERPDVIEARWRFASLPNLYHLQQFAAEYKPVLINRTRFFLRSDHARALLSAGIGALCPIKDLDCYANIETRHRYYHTLATTSEDDAEYSGYGSYIAIPDSR